MGGVLKNALSTMAGMVGGDLSVRGLMASFGGLKEAIIGTNATLESSTLQFETLMGSAERAKTHVESLFEFAKKTPFETGPVIQASKLLQTFGGDALNTTKNLTMVGDATAATGGQINDLAFWVGRAYSMIQGGQPFGEAAMRLQELAVLTPKARQEMEALQKQQKGSAEVWKVMEKELSRFSGAMEKQAGTWAGVTSTLKDIFNLTLAKAFEPAFKAVRDSIKGLNDYLSGPEFTKGAEAFTKGFGNAIKGLANIFRELWPLVVTTGKVVFEVATMLVSAGKAIIDVWSAMPRWFQEIAKVAAEVALALWAINAATKATMQLQAAKWFMALGKEMLTALQYAKSDGWKGFGFVVGEWAKPLTSAWGSLAKMTASFLSLGPALGTVMGTSVGLVGALGAVGIAIASLTAVVMAGKAAWDYYKASQEWKASDKNRDLEKTNQILIANKLSLQDGKGAITEYGAAMTFLTERGQRLRKEQEAGQGAAKDAAKAQTQAGAAAAAAAEAMEQARQALAGMSDETKAGVANALALGTSQKDIAKQFGLTAATVKLFKDELKGGTGPAASFAKSLAQLSTELAAAKMAGVPMTIVLEEYGSKIEDIVNKAPIFGKALTQPIKDAYKALQEAEMKKVLEGIRDKTSELAAEWNKEEIKKRIDAMAASTDALANAFLVAADYQERFLSEGMSASQKRLASIEKERKAALAGVGVAPPGMEAQFKKTRDAINQFYDYQRDKANQTQDTIVDRMRDAGVSTRDDMKETAARLKTDFEQMRASGKFTAEQVQAAWKKFYDADQAARGQWGTGFFNTIGKFAGLFKDLAQTAGGSLGKVAGVVGNLIQTMQLGREAGLGMKEGMSAIADGQVAAGLAQVGTSALAAIGAINQAMQQGSKASRTMSMAATGASIGSAFGPWGTLIGAGIGALVGLVSKDPGWKQIQDRIQNKLGVAISDGTAKAIDASRKQFKNDMQAAEIFNLDKIIADAGGVKASTLNKFTSALHDAFSMVQLGKFTKAQAAEVIDKTWGMLAEAAQKNGGLISKQMREIIALNDEFGTKSAAIADFLRAQSNAVTEGLNKIVAGFAKPVAESKKKFDELTKSAEDLKAKLAEALASGDKEGAAKLTEALTKAQAELAKLGPQAATTQEAFSRMGRLMSLAFDTSIASGKGYLATIMELGPSIQSLTDVQKQFGFESSAAFADVSRIYAFVTANQELFAQIDGVNQMLVGLSNSNRLTQDGFADLGAIASESFQKMLDGGLTADEATRALQPTLQTLWKLQQEYGFQVDETTQAMLDQAVATGQVGMAAMSADEKIIAGLDKVADGIGALVTLFGGTLPDSMTKAAKAAGDMAAEITRQGQSIPDVVIRARYNVDDLPGGPEGGGGEVPVPGAQEGVYAARPTLRVFGEGGEPELGGPVDFMAKVLRQAQSRGDAKSSGGGSDNLNISISIQALDSSDLKAKVERDILPAIIDAVRQNRRGSKTDLSGALTSV